mgnify:CR=1 FL=1
MQLPSGSLEKLKSSTKKRMQDGPQSRGSFSNHPFGRDLEDYCQSKTKQHNIYQQNRMYGTWNASMTEMDFGFDIRSYFKYTG